MVGVELGLFDGLIQGKYFRYNLHSSLQFVLFKFGIDIFIAWKLCALPQRSNFGIFHQFFHHNFQLKLYFFIYEIIFLGENFRFFFRICFRNASQVQWFCKFWWLHRKNLSDYNQILLKRRIEVIEKQIFSSEKMRSLSNCIYDYAHSFFGEDF